MSTSGDKGKNMLRGVGAEVSCDGKVPFDTRKLATSVLRRKTRSDRRRRSAYRCLHCGKWHLGMDMGRVAKRTAADFRRAKIDE